MHERVLIVDDDVAVRDSLTKAVESSGYLCVGAGDAGAALSILSKHPVAVAVIDIVLPGRDGMDLLEQIHIEHPDTTCILATGHGSEETAVRALRLGAADYLVKPFGIPVLLEAIERALARRQGAENSRLQQRQLLQELRLRDKDLEKVFLSTIKALVTAIEARDRYTINHAKSVVRTSLQIARQLMQPTEEQRALQFATLLHDVGYLGLSDAVWTKAGKLTSEDLAYVKRHPVIGEKILRPIANMPTLAIDVRHHHERYDGTGYPDGLRGDAVPLNSRIIALADAYDAMVSARSYRQALSIEEALTEIQRGRGTQFDPDIVDAFLALSRVLGVGRAKILLFVPDVDERTQIDNVVQEAGYQSVEAETREECLDLIAVERPDLVIIDAAPSVRGPDVFAAIRSARSSLPVLVCSAFEDIELDDFAHELSFLPKPVHPPVLVAEVKKLLVEARQ